MIELQNVGKSFDGIDAVRNLSLTIKEKSVFGMIGTNGAGKSTVLRMMSGILKPDEGQVLLDGGEVYENMEAKRSFFFISDEPYFFANANAEDMARYYGNVYEAFDREKFRRLTEQFGLGKKRKISTFSKGMKKQLALLLAVCARTKYIYCDETFDGLDPVMRQGIKALFASELEERGLTPVIASHNLRELEDVCDAVGLLHKGGVLLSKAVEELKCNLQKIQCVFTNDDAAQITLGKLDVMKKEERGRLVTLTVRGGREKAESVFAEADTVFYEILPLSLEEIFISETEVIGYDVKKLIFG